MKKFVKQVSSMNGKDVAWWQQKQCDHWVRIDKYGDVVNGPGASNSVILNWLLDGLVELVESQTFEKKIQWPRVFRTPAITLVAVSATKKLIEISSDFKLYDLNTMESQAWINEYGKRNVELFGEERERALKVYNALS